MEDLLAGDKGGEIMVLELNEKEKETLKHALKVLDGELKTERVGTDRKDWKAEFREEEHLVEELLRKVA